MLHSQGRFVRLDLMEDQTRIGIEWHPDRIAFDLRLHAPDGNITDVFPFPADRYPQLLHALGTAAFIMGAGAGPYWVKIVLNCLAEPRSDFRIDDLIRRDLEAAIV